MSREGLFAFGPLVRAEGVPVAGPFTARCSEIWGSCSGRAHSGWRFRFRAPSIREVDFAFCRAAARGFFSRKAWRAASRLDRGRRSGRAASESCGRFRKAAHVFVCRFDLADSGLTGPFFRCHVRAGILHPPVAARSRRPRIRFGPCPESLPPEEGSCREPSASEIRRSAQRKLMRLGKHGGRIGRRIPGCD